MSYRRSEWDRNHVPYRDSEEKEHNEAIKHQCILKNIEDRYWVMRQEMNANDHNHSDYDAFTPDMDEYFAMFGY